MGETSEEGMASAMIEAVQAMRNADDVARIPDEAARRAALSDLVGGVAARWGVDRARLLGELARAIACGNP
jgi:hypothetical protein